MFMTAEGTFWFRSLLVVLLFLLSECPVMKQRLIEMF